MALASSLGRKPKPSSTIRTTGVRGPCLFAMLRAMQSSRALHALPVVVCLSIPALGAPLAGQAGYRITSDGAWFFQEAGGKRLARLARGAQVSGGEAGGGGGERRALRGWG